MAVTVKGDQVTNIDAGTKLESWEKNRVRRFYFSYTTDNTETVASTIEVARIPKGASIDPSSVVHFEAMGGSATFAFGDGDDADRYKAAASCVSAGSLFFDRILGMGYEVGTADDDEVIYITTAGSTLADDKEIHGYIQYVY